MKKIMLALLLAVCLSGCVVGSMPIKPPEAGWEDKIAFNYKNPEELESVLRRWLGKRIIKPHDIPLEIVGMKRDWAVDAQGKYHFGILVIFRYDTRVRGYGEMYQRAALIENGEITMIWTLMLNREGKPYTVVPDYRVWDGRT